MKADAEVEMDESRPHQEPAEKVFHHEDSSFGGKDKEVLYLRGFSISQTETCLL